MRTAGFHRILAGGLWSLAMAITVANGLFRIPYSNRLPLDTAVLLLFTASLAASIGFMCKHRWGQLATRRLAPLWTVVSGGLSVALLVPSTAEEGNQTRLLSMIAACYFAVSLYAAITSWSLAMFPRVTSNRSLQANAHDSEKRL